MLLMLVILFNEDGDGDDDDDDDDDANDNDDYTHILMIYQQEMKEPMLPPKTLRLHRS